MPFNSNRRVPYNMPGTQYWSWISVYGRMSRERILFVNQPLTDSFANEMISALLYLDSDDQTKPIYFYINSLGDPVAAGMGSVMYGMMSITAGLAIYDTMQHIKSEIVTICLGQSMGMATLLLSSGAPGKRASLPHSTIALNHPKVGATGQASDIQINAKEVLEKKDLVLEILSQNTGQSIEKIAKDTDRMFYMSPQEAQEYGLIDRVLESAKLRQPEAVLI